MPSSSAWEPLGTRCWLEPSSRHPAPCLRRSPSRTGSVKSGRAGRFTVEPHPERTGQAKCCDGALSWQSRYTRHTTHYTPHTTHYTLHTTHNTTSYIIPSALNHILCLHRFVSFHLRSGRAPIRKELGGSPGHRPDGCKWFAARRGHQRCRWAPTLSSAK